MKIRAFAVVAIVFSAGLSALAEENAPATQPVNKMCAVMTKDKADPKVTYVYDGKTYAFCCTDCIDVFKKDPEKYAKEAK